VQAAYELERDVVQGIRSRSAGWRREDTAPAATALLRRLPAATRRSGGHPRLMPGAVATDERTPRSPDLPQTPAAVVCCAADLSPVSRSAEVKRVSTGVCRRAATVAAALLVLVARPAFAQPTQLTAAEREAAYQARLVAPRPVAAGSSLWLEELTWMEVRDRIADGVTTVILPTGGVEENGPFLSTGKHNLILEGTCPVIAERLGNALCAPIVKFVPEGSIEPPSGAMRFPGSISLEQSTYEALLTDIARSLRQSGFRDIVMIGDSGGNQRGMANVAAALAGAWAGSGTRIHFVREYYEPGWEATEQFSARELGIVQTRDDGHHDDIWVTLMMMVSDPEQVRLQQRIDADLASINGVAIVPLERAVELGRRMIAFRAELTVDAIRRALTADE
jgi:creatinine amidohydrolase/Fe(II)-dependent formamide hydrolase-like protein